VFPTLGENEVGNWFMFRAYHDADFRNAWFGQQQNPRAWKVAHVVARRQLYKELSRREGLMEGRQATEDRAMVAASMKGSGAKMNGAEPAPWFGGMSDAELKDYTRRNFGF
jgi:hypothetical protein